MKSFLNKRWHSIPVALVSAVLVLALVAGGAFAAYSFFTTTAQVQVIEAIAVGMGTWDNLEPYGSVDDVNITVDGDVLTITASADTPYVGEGFCPGEWIVFPLNIRNGSDGDLTLGATVESNGLIVTASYELNVGAKTDEIPAGHEGDFLAYDFKAMGTFGNLNGWSVVVDGNSGFSGSAVHNAQVLFVKISVPGDAAPSPEGTPSYTLTITLDRS